MQTPGSAGTSLGGGSPQAWRLALRLHPSSGVRTGRVRGPALSFPLTLLHHHPAHKALLFYCVSVCASPCRWAPAQVGPAHRPLSPRAARAGRKVLSSLPSGRRALSLGGWPTALGLGSLWQAQAFACQAPSRGSGMAAVLCAGEAPTCSPDLSPAAPPPPAAGRAPLHPPLYSCHENSLRRRAHCLQAWERGWWPGLPLPNSSAERAAHPGGSRRAVTEQLLGVHRVPMSPQPVRLTVFAVAT